MTNFEAFDAGQEAFRKGRERTAALNTTFSKEACKHGKGDTMRALFREYERGWDEAEKFSKKEVYKPIDIDYDSCEGWD